MPRQESLAVSRVCGPSCQGRESEPHIRHEAYLKLKKIVSPLTCRLKQYSGLGTLKQTEDDFRNLLHLKRQRLTGDFLSCC